MGRQNAFLRVVAVGGWLSGLVMFGPSVAAVTAPGPSSTGSAKGTLTVGSSKLPLSHAYAVARKPKDGGRQGFHLFLTSKAMPVADIKDVTDSSAVGMFLLEHEMQGIEAIVTADGGVQRVNIRHPELEGMGMALGVTLLEAPKLEVAAVDSAKLQGKLFTEKAITDGRIAGKAVAFEATFTAPIQGASTK